MARRGSQAFRDPATILSASQAQGGGRGVCQHRDFGWMGGGHHDCGSGFPIHYVVQRAGGVAVTPPSSGGRPQMSGTTSGRTTTAPTATSAPGRRNADLGVVQPRPGRREFGPNTESVAKRFQTQQGLTSDGWSARRRGTRPGRNPRPAVSRRQADRGRTPESRHRRPATGKTADRSEPAAPARPARRRGRPPPPTGPGGPPRCRRARRATTCRRRFSRPRAASPCPAGPDHGLPRSRSTRSRCRTAASRSPRVTEAEHSRDLRLRHRPRQHLVAQPGAARAPYPEHRPDRE